SHTERMECRNQRIAGARALQQIPHTEFHLVGGLVGESHSENRIRTDTDPFHKVHHPIGDDAGLSTPGPCQDEDRPFSGLDGFELLRVEKLAEIHSSFYRNAFSEVSRLVDVAATPNRDMIS